jgi:acetoin utilization deacetylase AcuC-like enzyme
VPKGENMVNVPIPPYTRGGELRETLMAMWMPRLEEFSPEMVFISAGFDGHREDDMGQLGLVEADFEWITRQVVGVADRCARGRVVSVLEGGYNLSALARSVAAHIRVLADV